MALQPVAERLALRRGGPLGLDLAPDWNHEWRKVLVIRLNVDRARDRPLLEPIPGEPDIDAEGPAPAN